MPIRVEHDRGVNLQLIKHISRPTPVSIYNFVIKYSNRYAVKQRCLTACSISKEMKLSKITNRMA